MDGLCGTECRVNVAGAIVRHQGIQSEMTLAMLLTSKPHMVHSIPHCDVYVRTKLPELLKHSSFTDFDRFLGKSK